MFIVVCIIRHPSLQTITNYTLFSTGMAHIVFQFMCLIFIFKMEDFCSFGSPLTFLAFLFIGMVAVFANTVLVTIETYLKVCHPFLYARVVTDRKCFILIALIWVISFCSGAMAGTAVNGNGNDNDERCPFAAVIEDHGRILGIILNITLVPSLVIISVLKFLVIRTARKQAMRIGALDVREPPQPPQPPHQQPNDDMVEQLQHKIKNIRKSTINLAIFVGTYICGWVPILLISNISFYTNKSIGIHAPVIIFLVVANLTSVGPLVYTLRQTEFSRLQKRYVQQIKAYVCGHFGDIRIRIQVNVIKTKPTTETEFGESVPQ
ncbi:adenosine receptor A2b-like [Strongylocentrotus purpuratus]|uniref:G-protein coupled receptors family 1 profile domain-containing protein n=1 Tax=Strongylocentrotus purpuratus TaxID=7668 RepID=A0A7M7G3W2_STRPU|nr:adenosine receptor A2b-like [Strongylocentrotus purpuratus]